jgi:hypothetical protein
VGDTVEFDHAGITGTYELVEFHSAIKPTGSNAMQGTDTADLAST